MGLIKALLYICICNLYCYLGISDSLFYFQKSKSPGSELNVKTKRSGAAALCRGNNVNLRFERNS